MKLRIKHDTAALAIRPHPLRHVVSRRGATAIVVTISSRNRGTEKRRQADAFFGSHNGREKQNG